MDIRDTAFLKGAMFGASVVVLSVMISRAPWPDLARTAMLLLTWAGWVYLAWMERRRGDEKAPPWRERKRPS